MTLCGVPYYHYNIPAVCVIGNWNNTDLVHGTNVVYYSEIGLQTILEKVTVHDRCPFFIGSLIWGKYDTVLISVPWRRVLLYRGCPLIRVSLEDGFYCIEGILSSKCPLKTGFTVLDMTGTTSCDRYHQLWPVPPVVTGTTSCARHEELTTQILITAPV